MRYIVPKNIREDIYDISDVTNIYIWNKME